MRTSAYAAVLLSGQLQSKSKARLTAFAKQISAARVVLRLFDDVPMWRVTRNWAADVRERILVLTLLTCSSSVCFISHRRVSQSVLFEGAQIAVETTV